MEKNWIYFVNFLILSDFGNWFSINYIQENGYIYKFEYGHIRIEWNCFVKNDDNWEFEKLVFQIWS